MQAPTRYQSPDGRKCVELDYVDEVRFGPALFQARTSGFEWPLGSALIGEDIHWSSDSRYVVVLVFRSTDSSKAPHVELVAVDTNTGTVVTVDQNQQGVIQQHGFLASGVYEYNRVQHGTYSQAQWTPP